MANEALSGAVEAAFQRAAESHGIERADEAETWVQAVSWALGDKILYEQLADIVADAIEVDRRERAPFEQFGVAVYNLMDGQEWDSDTTSEIAAFASVILDRPFRDPNDVDNEEADEVTPVG